jgi:predicted anti-sigma-YlaC factor YlaD
MNCKTIREQLPDVALSTAQAPPEVEAHLSACVECSGTLEALRATMNLMDEWTAPEPSPFWDVRMQARLREEQQRVPAGVLRWFRRPVFSLAAALCLVVGIGSVQIGRFLHEADNPPIVVSRIPVPTGTAVADLQYLDRNSDMLQNFDALDVLDGDDDADSN